MSRAKLVPVYLPKREKFDFDKSSKFILNVIPKMIDKSEMNQISILDCNRAFYQVKNHPRSPEFISKLIDVSKDVIFAITEQAKNSDFSNSLQDDDDSIPKIRIICDSFDKFNCFKRNYYSLFGSYEKMFASRSHISTFDSMLTSQWTSAIKETYYLSNLTKSFVSSIFKIMKENAVDTILSDARISTISEYKKIIEIIAPSELKEVLKGSIEKITVFMSNFIENDLHLPITFDGEVPDLDEELGESIEDNDEELMENVQQLPEKTNKLFAMFETFFEAILGKREANDIIASAYTYMSQPDSAFMREIFRSIPMFCFSREREVIADIYQFYEKKPAIKKQVISIVCKTILKESHDLEKMQEAADFYHSFTIDIFPKNLEILDAISKYVNYDKQQIVKDVNTAINKNLQTKASISKYSSILKFIAMKNEFVTSYTKKLLWRMLTGGYEQLERETKAREVIVKTKCYDTDPIDEIIKGRLRGNDLHFTNVLFIRQDKFIYTVTPNSSPIHIADKVDLIKAKYKEKYPDQKLSFPLEFSYFVLKDNKRNIVITGTGVQAEVLLAFNEKNIITSQSLGIAPELVESAIDSLETDEYPLLRKAAEMHQLNNKATFKENVIHLPPPKESRKNSVQSSLISNVERTASVIAKTLKTTKMMNKKELYLKTFSTLAEKMYFIDEDVFREAITNLSNSGDISIDDDIITYNA